MSKTTVNSRQSEIAERWRTRGFGCSLWVDPPGQCWEDFVHATDELVAVVKGEVEFKIASKVHRLVPGEELLIPAGTIHSVRNIGTGTACWLYGYKR